MKYLLYVRTFTIPDMGEEEPAPFWSRKCLPRAADVGKADRVNAVLELTRLALCRGLLSPDTAKIL